MTEPLDPGSHVVEVEPEIDQVTVVNPAEATATVRCMLGPVRCGARFDHVRGVAEAIDGAGVQLLASAAPRSGWQVIRGPIHRRNRLIHKS